MELSPDSLVARLAGEPLCPVYMVTGPEPLLVLEAADAIRAHAREQGYAEREVFDADGRDFDWGPLAATFRAPSLFSSQRLVELRLPTARPGKEGAELIVDYCAQPPGDIVLLITGNEWSKKHGGKWSEAVARTGRLAVARALRPDQMTGWVEARLRMRGVKADRGAVQRLVERVEGNLLAAAQEIDKLALLADGQPLDAARMESLVADAARFDVFRMIDSALNGQGARAARMLAGLRAEGEAIPALMGMVVKELLTVATLARAQARGANMAAEFRAQRVWASKEAVYRRALQRHPALQWERFVAEAGRVDRIAKGRADGDAWQVLERLLLAVAEAKARPLLGQAPGAGS
ncbi:DNA polymerase III subunit delta [Luteimonas lutimaris]|uniref:DNA polymerase III subunit delta n=1 Tax=Luteimonas lutimaris TaxID=698645 RepID=A0ABP7MVZ6_9GAMM